MARITFRLRQGGFFHRTIQFLTVAQMAHTLSVLCYLIHYGIYAFNGVGAPGLGLFAKLMFVVGDTFTLLLTISLARTSRPAPKCRCARFAERTKPRTPGDPSEPGRAMRMWNLGHAAVLDSSRHRASV